MCVNLNQNDPRLRITTYGDVLERHMFHDTTFADSFSLYPRIWSDYVLPNREPLRPSMIAAQWLPFAQHH